jgi:hypothetical protein
VCPTSTIVTDADPRHVDLTRLANAALSSSTWPPSGPFRRAVVAPAAVSSLNAHLASLSPRPMDTDAMCAVYVDTSQKSIILWGTGTNRCPKPSCAFLPHNSTGSKPRIAPGMKPPNYKPGDLVLLKTKYFAVHSGFCHKFAPRWLGLFEVLEVL